MSEYLVNLDPAALVAWSLTAMLVIFDYRLFQKIIGSFLMKLYEFFIGAKRHPALF